MAGSRKKRLLFGLGGVALVQAVVFGGLTLFAGTTTVHAELSGVQKDCEGPGPNKESIQNQNTTCTITAQLGGPTGTEFDVTLTFPGSVVTSCTKTGGPADIVVTGPSGNNCTWVVGLTTVNPNTVIGTEVIHVGAGAANGALLTQSGRSCPPAPLGCPPGGPPFNGGYSMIVGPGNSGNGWCVGAGSTNQGGLALSCMAGGSSTSSHSSSSSSNSSSEHSSSSGEHSSHSEGGGGGGEQSSQSAVNSVKALANTAAPAHPFPTAPLTVAVIGLLVAASAGLALVRMRRGAKRPEDIE